MSLAFKQLQSLVVRDPKTEINTQRFYTIKKGASQVSFKPNISTSYSTSSIQFSAPPPNPKIIVDKKLYMVLPVHLEFTGADQGSPLLQYGVHDSFRAYPVTQIIQTLNITLNNTSVSVNMNDIFPSLMRYYTFQDDDFLEYSMSPTMQDQFQNYSDINNGARNVMNAYADSSPYENARGNFPVTITNLTNTTATIDAILVEPIFLSPLTFGMEEEAGFIGLQTFDFNFTLGDLRRLWSHNTLGNNYSLTVSFPAAPQLLFNYLTPNLLQDVPQSIVYPYYSLDRYPTTVGSLGPNVATTTPSANIQLQSIPNRMYIFARKKNSEIALAPFTSTDTFAAIERVSINWNNNSGLLSSASQYDLYKMSVKNGCKMSWPQWSGGPVYNGTTAIGTIGSVLCISFADDIGLTDLEAPGLLGTYQLQMDVTLRNKNQSSAINFDLYIVVVSEGTFTIIENRAVANIGVISKEEILNSDKLPRGMYNEMKNIYGGDFLSGVKKFFSKAKDVFQKSKPYLTAIADVAKSTPIAAYTEPARQILGVGRRRRYGRALVGGRAMTREMLRQNLDDYGDEYEEEEEIEV